MIQPEFHRAGSMEGKMGMKLMRTRTSWNPRIQAGTHKDKGLDLISASHHLQASNFGAAVILQDMLMPFNLEINIHHGLEVKEDKG